MTETFTLHQKVATIGTGARGPEGSAGPLTIRRIAKECNHIPRELGSELTLLPCILAQIKDNDTVFLHTTAIDNFSYLWREKIKTKFILVTGCSIKPAVSLCSEWILTDPRIVHWFAQNCNIVHPKITPIPLGLDFHQSSDPNQEKDLIEIRNSFSKQKRKINILCNFFGAMTVERGKAAFILSHMSESVFIRDHFPREIIWQEHGHHQFVASPAGAGMDCYRTWEALVLGCIPIVKWEPYTRVFDDLPVLIVSDWCDLLSLDLAVISERMNMREYNWEKLQTSYWIEKINRFTACARVAHC